MKIIDKYIIKAFLWNYFIAMFVMMGLYIIIDMYLNLDEFLKESEPVTVVVSNIASYYGHNMFLYFAQLAGLITIVAGATTMARMQRSNELTALLASGTSLHRVAAPLIVMALLMNGLWVLDQEVIIPHFADKLARPRDDMEGQRSYKIWFVQDGKGGLLSALNYSPADEQIKHMLVIRRTPSGSLQEIITAEVANWDEQRQTWNLVRGGNMYKDTKASNPGLQQTQIQRTGVATYDSSLGPKELMYRQNSQWTDFLSLARIRQLEQDKMGPQTRLAKVKHSRVTTPIMNVVLLIIGLYAFLHCQPRPIIKDATISLVMAGICFGTTFVAINLVSTSTHPELPAWLPVIVFGPIAAVLLDSVKT
jgi:lipopolysaccharide export system permease protein